MDNFDPTLNASQVLDSMSKERYSKFVLEKQPKTKNKQPDGNNNVQMLESSSDQDQSPCSDHDDGKHGSSLPVNASFLDERQQQTLDYLKELYKERGMLPATTPHLNRLLDDEIKRVQEALLQIDSDAVDKFFLITLPPPSGAVLAKSKKLFLPVDKYPDLNFIGRIIGPRGLTIRELEADSGCKLYIRGKGSMRNKEKEAQFRGQSGYEHLDEDLHVQIAVEEAENRVDLMLDRATSLVERLLESVINNQCDVKQRQLTELANLNDKYMVSPDMVSNLPFTSMFPFSQSKSSQPFPSSVHHQNSSSIPTMLDGLGGPASGKHHHHKHNGRAKGGFNGRNHNGALNPLFPVNPFLMPSQQVFVPTQFQHQANAVPHSFQPNHFSAAASAAQYADPYALASMVAAGGAGPYYNALMQQQQHQQAFAAQQALAAASANRYHPYGNSKTK